MVDEVVVELDRGREVRRLAVVVAVLAVAAVSGWALARTDPLAWLGPLTYASMAVVGALLIVGRRLVTALQRPQLLLDASGIRWQRRHRVPRWSIPWNDLASAVTVTERDGHVLLLEPRDAEVVRRHRGAGTTRRHGELQVWRVELGPADPAPVAAALAGRVPRSRGGVLDPPPAPQEPAQDRTSSTIDLGARDTESRLRLGVGAVLLVFLTVGLLATAVAGPEELWLRLTAGGVGLVLSTLLVAWWRSRAFRPRWLTVDHAGLRLVGPPTADGRRRDLVRVAWTEVAGVGVMVNERARARAATSRRIGHATIWLELYPTGPDAVRRHPELRTAWQRGRAVRPGQEQRWLIALGYGRTVPVEEHVRRWRPELWRGQRDGSLLFG